MTPSPHPEVPAEIRDVAREAFAGRPPMADGVFALPSDRNPWRALDDALAAVYLATRKQVFADMFGTDEEIAAREAEAANARPDDPVELCEVILPGQHERRVRAKAAEEIEAQFGPLDPESEIDETAISIVRWLRGQCMICGRPYDGGESCGLVHTTLAAAIARGEQP